MQQSIYELLLREVVGAVEDIGEANQLDRRFLLIEQPVREISRFQAQARDDLGHPYKPKLRQPRRWLAWGVLAQKRLPYEGVLPEWDCAQDVLDIVAHLLSKAGRWQTAKELAECSFQGDAAKREF